MPNPSNLTFAFHDLASSQSDQTMSQLTVDNEADSLKLDTIDAVEGAGIQSQMERMKKRLEQLEKEKMDLSMSKAPLEARFRQKEESWLKERARLAQEIET